MIRHTVAFRLKHPWFGQGKIFLGAGKALADIPASSASSAALSAR